MQKVMLFVPLMRMVVLFFLLVGAQLLCYKRIKIPNMLAAILLGGGHAFLCLHPSFLHLSNPFLYYFVTAVIGLMGIGTVNNAMVLFVALSLLLDGLTAKNGVFLSIIQIVLGGAGTLGILRYCKRGHLLPVTLCYGNKTVSIYALYDTGNTLIDPVSGRSVLVVSAAVARELTGLTHEQLRTPVESIGLVPGLRLIPYKSVGSNSGFMLGLSLDEVKLGGKKAGKLIAFAPYGLDEDGKYQALAGGYV